MTTITFSGNATKDALTFSPHAAEILKRNIERQILAKESGENPSGMFGIDLDAPLDERIVWTDESSDEGISITGTLEV